MIGYIIVSHDDEVYSNRMNISLDSAKENVLYRKFDKYFTIDVQEGRFVSNINDVHKEADFETAIDGYINLSEWIIAVDIDTNNIDIYYNGILENK